MDETPTPSSAAPITSRSHHQILIIGGGTAGLTIAARLRRADQADVAVIEPSDLHYYQPLWTLVGAGQVSAQATVQKEAKYIPSGVRWIQDAAEEIDPSRNAVRLSKGGEVGYDFLVVCPGIQINWDAIGGLREALDTPYVSSNYAYALAPKTWRMIQDFGGGNAVFTHPGTPIKCAGAPQKIMYLAADHFGRSGIAKKANVVFGIAGAAIFAVKEFAAVLTQVVERYGIDVHFKRELVEIRPREKEAVFEIKDDPG
jgi:sulfide:quinone oxidoreductase